ncbi:Acetyltransferase (GNAT) domain-containing protein [Agrobacterium fabrum]|jgi:GNAT superfamily N-acetyltransferase|uniref:GNAT family N-acetyltransferase n=1 Tax=Agrobacterium fabrum TaxID=1176649 RepID=UPI00088150FB|nr:GNAT family N-acetyltransferase [Agrobacterium fabrum]MDH6295211.1 GNAT superfamily N-acetyltransferase [Agrobacterium fabrum]SDB61947.1 Acetyltransferase (GNAT) domain-containing protein [Agrobacterium fabrum]SER27953.1 Acetyltransferase (GNAT) domain-containing protein [Agrobacterium fabrum]
MELLKVDSFELRTVDIADVEADHLHALSMAVGWQYHANEWCFLRQCGVGLAALDEIDRVVATAMLFAYDEGFATLGMVIVSPRLQGQGVAPWLVRRLLAKFPVISLRINATDESRRLFARLGFTGETEKVQLFRGKVQRPAEMPPGRKQKIELLSEDHLIDVADMDRAAFGISRRRVLLRLLKEKTGYGLFEAGRLVAFAFRRAAGRGHIIGPVVAVEEMDAIMLVSRHFADLEDQLARLDAVRDSGAFSDFLAQSGLVVIETLTTMSKDEPQPMGSGTARIFALAGPSLF